MSPRTARAAASGPRLPLSQAELLAVVDHADAVAHLKAYFTHRNSAGTPAWIGARFESLAGGGDRPDTVDRLHLNEIVAVILLRVSIPQ